MEDRWLRRVSTIPEYFWGTDYEKGVKEADAKVLGYELLRNMRVGEPLLIEMFQEMEIDNNSYTPMKKITVGLKVTKVANRHVTMEITEYSYIESKFLQLQNKVVRQVKNLVYYILSQFQWYYTEMFHRVPGAMPIPNNGIRNWMKKLFEWSRR